VKLHQRLQNDLELGFIRRFVKPSSSLLDVGCGRSAPLVGILAETPTRTPGRYLGLDAKFNGVADFTWAEYTTTGLGKLPAEQFSIIVARHGDYHPRALRDRLADAGVLFIGVDYTTFKPEKLERELAKADLEVTDRRGVRSDPDMIKAAATPAEKRAFKELLGFYDPAVAASLIATTDHEVATYAIWVVRHRGERAEVKAPEMKNSPNPDGTAKLREKLGVKKTRRPAERKPAQPDRPSPGQNRRRPRAAVKPRPAESVASDAGGRRGGAVADVDGERFRTSGALIRHCLKKGGRSDAEILELNKKAFPWSKAKQSDVNWNRRRLT
jgi:hypothetical protein